MHRMKIGLVAAIVLLAFTGGHLQPSSRASSRTRSSTAWRPTSPARSGCTATSRASRRSSSRTWSPAWRAAPRWSAVFAKSDETGRRQAAFEQCEQINGFLQTGGARKADIVAILDAAGKVVARDLNVNAMYGEDLRSKYPAVATALRGEATKDIWTLRGA